MGKRKLKPRIREIDKRLVEVSFWNTSMVLCVHCYQVRESAYPYNRTMRYKGQEWSRAPYPFKLIAQPAGWEKLKCQDCGQKNENPNMAERRFQYGRHIE